MNRGSMIGYALAFVVVVPTIVWGIFYQGDSANLNALLVVAGTLVGWIVGMLMAPVSPGETKRFPEYGKAISTFAGGYLVGKVDKLFDLYFKDGSAINELLVGRAALIVIGFALGALSTYVWRAYGSSGKQLTAVDGSHSHGC